MAYLGFRKLKLASATVLKVFES